MTTKGGKKKSMWIFGRSQESQKFNKPRGETGWFLECSKTSWVDRKDTSGSASYHCSCLWRDGQELAGSLRCHIHQPWLSGTGSSVTKWNCTWVSMWVRMHVRGAGAANTIDMYSWRPRIQLLAGTPRGSEWWPCTGWEGHQSYNWKKNSSCDV